MKKFLCFALCIIFCLGALVGCGGLGEDEKGPSIRMYLTDFPYTLDPAAIQLNSDADTILSLIYEPLTAIDEDGDVVGALATEWEYVYDEIYSLHKMTFELRDTKWSDNRKVSAADVVYAWTRILDPEFNSPYASLLYGIKGARAVKAGVATIDDLGIAATSDTTLEVTFEDEYNYDLFAEQVANVHLAPCREDVISRNPETWCTTAADMVCNGPFRIQTMDMPSEKSESKSDSDCKLVIERNAYYRRSESMPLDKYVTPYRIVCLYSEGLYRDYKDDGKVTQEAFQAYRYIDGSVYFLSSFEKQTYDYFKNDIETVNTLNGFAFYFNTENELLKDADVRKAFSAAIDRTAITEATGTGERPANGYVPNGVFNTDGDSDFREVGGDLYNVKSDMDAAKALVKGKSKEGTLTAIYLIPQNEYTVKNFKNNVSYSNSYKVIMEKAAEYWTKLGYTVECKGLYPTEYFKALTNREFDIIGTNISGGSSDALCYLAPFAKEYSGAGTVIDYSVDLDDTTEVFGKHYSNIDDADYSALIDSAVKTNDRAERAEILHNAEKKLAELCPATMVFWYTNSYVASSDVSGYDTNWYGYFDFKDLTLKNWRKVNAAEESAEESK